MTDVGNADLTFRATTAGWTMEGISTTIASLICNLLFKDTYLLWPVRAWNLHFLILKPFKCRRNACTSLVGYSMWCWTRDRSVLYGCVELCLRRDRPFKVDTGSFQQQGLHNQCGGCNLCMPPRADEAFKQPDEYKIQPAVSMLMKPSQSSQPKETVIQREAMQKH